MFLDGRKMGPISPMICAVPLHLLKSSHPVPPFTLLLTSTSGRNQKVKWSCPTSWKVPEKQFNLVDHVLQSVTWREAVDIRWPLHCHQAVELSVGKRLFFFGAIQLNQRTKGFAGKKNTNCKRFPNILMSPLPCQIYTGASTHMNIYVDTNHLKDISRMSFCIN